MRYLLLIFILSSFIHAKTVVDSVSITAKEVGNSVEVFFEYHTRFVAGDDEDAMQGYGKSISFCKLKNSKNNKTISSGSYKSSSLYSSYFSKPLKLTLPAKHQLHLINIECTTELSNQKLLSNATLILSPKKSTQIKEESKIEEPIVSKEEAKKAPKKKVTPKYFTVDLKLKTLTIKNIQKISFRNKNKNDFLVETDKRNYVLKKEDLKVVVFYNLSKKTTKELEKVIGVKLKVQNPKGYKSLKLDFNK